MSRVTIVFIIIIIAGTLGYFYRKYENKPIVTVVEPEIILDKACASHFPQYIQNNMISCSGF